MDKHERYRKLHPERVRAGHAAHYQRHKEVICERKRQWYMEHREAILQRMRERTVCQLCDKELTKRYICAHTIRKHGPPVETS